VLKSKLPKKAIALMCASVLSILSMVSVSALDVIDTDKATGTLNTYRVSGDVTLFEGGATAQSYCSYSKAARSVSVEYVYAQNGKISRYFQSQASPSSNPIASVTKKDKSCAALAGGGQHNIGFSGYSWKKVTRAGQDKLITLRF